MENQIKISILGDFSIGKKKLISSFSKIFNTIITNNEVTFTYCFIENVNTLIHIEIEDKERKISSRVKNSDLVFLCFRTDLKNSFLSLNSWIKSMEEKKIKKYFLLGNDFNVPFYSYMDIKTEAETMNNCFDLKYKHFHIFDFGDKEKVKKYMKMVVKQCLKEKVFNKKETEDSVFRSCVVI